jgi:hypothetical protein
MRSTSKPAVVNGFDEVDRKLPVEMEMAKKWLTACCDCISSQFQAYPWGAQFSLFV